MRVQRRPRSIYNREQKEQFISEFSTSESRRSVASIMFVALAPFEGRYGEVCTMDKDVLSMVVSEIVGGRDKSQNTRLSILREYCRWCISKGVPGANDNIFEINGDFGLEKFKRNMIANPQHLQRYLDCVCDEESLETVDNVFRCFYWLAYAGIGSEKDALDVRIGDVDFKHMTVHSKGEEFPIYRDAIPAFEKCHDLESFKVNHPQYNRRIRADGDRLLRRGIISNAGNDSVQSFRTAMCVKTRGRERMTERNRKDVSLDLKLSYYRVWLSGIFYRMYEAERAGIPPDFTETARRFMEGKDYEAPPDSNVLMYMQRQKAKEYDKDYQRWKQIYST